MDTCHLGEDGVTERSHYGYNLGKNYLNQINTTIDLEALNLTVS